MKQKQAGFGVVSIAITLVFIMTMGLWYAKAEQQRRLMSEVQPFVEQVAFIKDAINAYQLDKLNAGVALSSRSLFPARWSDLEGDYVTRCAAADHAKGYCKPIYQTPWGENMTLSIKSLHSPYYAAKITIPLPQKAPLTERQRQAHMAGLATFAEATFDNSSNTITLLIHKLSDEVKHELLLSRTGDKTLLGDWDVGGSFAITNARDVTVRNVNGTQRRLGAGVVNTLIAVDAQHISKHSCPQGLQPDITLSIKSLASEHLAISNLGQVKAWFEPRSRDWIVHLDYHATIEGENTLVHDGELNVTQICKV